MDQPFRAFKAEFFKALAHPVRLAILDQLREGERSVNDLCASLRADQPLVSQHLARLRTADIVRVRKQGTVAYYTVSDPTIFELLDVARRIFDNQLVNRQALLKRIRKEAREALKAH